MLLLLQAIFSLSIEVLDYHHHKVGLDDSLTTPSDCPSPLPITLHYTFSVSLTRVYDCYVVIMNGWYMNETNQIGNGDTPKSGTGKGDGSYMQAKLHLVDLAGSERAKRTGALGTRLKESVGINQVGPSVDAADAATAASDAGTAIIVPLMLHYIVWNILLSLLI